MDAVQPFYKISDYLTILNRACGIDSVHSGFLPTVTSSLQGSQQKALDSVFQALPESVHHLVVIDNDRNMQRYNLPEIDIAFTDAVILPDHMPGSEQLTTEKIANLEKNYAELIPGEYNAVLLYECAAVLPPNILFGQARELLAPDRSIVFAGYISHRSLPNESNYFYSFEEMKKHAMRSGFDLVREDDYTVPVLNYCDTLVSLLEDYRHGLHDTDVDQEELVQRVIEYYRFLSHSLHSNHLSWRILVFQCPDIKHGAFIRKYRVGDEAEINRLFAEVFEQDQTDMWHWKFQSRSTKPHAVLAFRDNRLIAQYTGLPRKFCIDGKNINALQICDIMVDRKSRGQWRRDGPFAATARSFIETYVGPDKPYSYTFGFPSERHLRLGVRLGLYEEVCRFWRLEKTNPCLQRSRRWRLDILTSRTRILNVTARLWQAMLRDFNEAALGVRDSEYIAWRYLDHPQQRYHFLLLRRRLLPNPVALAVIRIDRGCARIVDIVGKKRDFACFVRMIESHYTALEDVDKVEIMVTECYRKLFEKAGYHGSATEIVIPRINIGGGPDARAIRDRLFLMLGDSDLV